MTTTIETLNDAIDQLAADAGDVCAEAKALLELAWWYTEQELRAETGHCPVRCQPGAYCTRCAYFRKLTPRAHAVRRLL